MLKKKGRKGTQSWRKVVVRNNDISNARKVLERLKNRVDALRKMKLDALIKSNNTHPLFLAQRWQYCCENRWNIQKVSEGSRLALRALKARSERSTRSDTSYTTQALSGSKPHQRHTVSKAVGDKHQND